MSCLTRMSTARALPVLTLTFVGLALLPTESAEADPIPADVLARSDTARANMRRIANAMFAYADDHNGVFPPDLTMLYPSYVSDPMVFWHPADADPQPTSIDNNGPNQANSTRISYDY